MSHYILTDYVKDQLKQGFTKEAITIVLANSGWSDEEIESSLEQCKDVLPVKKEEEKPLPIKPLKTNFAPIPVFQTVLQPQTIIQEEPATNYIHHKLPVTERDFSLKKAQIFIGFIPAIFLIFVNFILAIAGIFHIIFVSLLVFAAFWGFGIFIKVFNFHYSLDSTFMLVSQGIFSNRFVNIDYSLVTNINIVQPLLFDKFNIASLVINYRKETEAPSQIFVDSTASNSNKKFSLPKISNQITIPGLSAEDAQTLKGIVMLQTKERPSKSVI